MSKETEYIVEHRKNGEIAGLYRFREDNKGHHAEVLLRDGTWQQDNGLIDVALNLHNPIYTAIAENEARGVAKQITPGHSPFKSKRL